MRKSLTHARASTSTPVLDRYAYTHTETAPNEWSVVLCEDGVAGYRLVPDYGPYDDEERAQGIAQRLNERLGMTEQRVRDVVRSSFMRAAVRAERRRAARESARRARWLVKNEDRQLAGAESIPIPLSQVCERWRDRDGRYLKSPNGLCIYCGADRLTHERARAALRPDGAT